MTTAYPPVQPHGDLEQLFDDVWRVNGRVTMAPTMHIGRNMVIVRDGEALTLINSVRLDAATEAALKALGTISHVVKLGIHGMDDAYYVDTFGAKMWALPAAKLAHDRVLTDVLVSAMGLTNSSASQNDGAASDQNAGSHGGCPIADMTVFEFKLTNRPDAALLLHRHGGVLITCDSVQQWEPSPRNSVTARAALRMMGFMNDAQIGPPWLKAQTPENGDLRADFERLVALPFRHIIGAHGGLLRDDGPARLRATMARVFK